MFITHKLREVRAVADRITVIRRGAVVGETSPRSTETELAGLMVGREVSLTTAKEAADPGEVSFEVRGLTVLNSADKIVVDDVDLSLRRGEILVIAGVDGNGQSELAQTILGIRSPVAGSILLDDKDLAPLSIKQRLAAGLGFVPEDRSTDGVIGAFTITENYALDMYDRPPYAGGPGNIALRLPVMREAAQTQAERFDVRMGTVDDPISTLSGGNQQKVVLAREMSRALRLFVASQPTRGLDVGSIEFVHRTIIEERDKGTPCLIVSTELDEALNLADRIAVMYRGRVVGIVPASTSRDVLGLMMAGVPAEEAQTQAATHHTVLAEADERAEAEENK